MKRYAVMLLLLCCLCAAAQEQQTWEQVWQEVMSPEDLEETDWDDCLERMQQLADCPIDLNRCRREDLEQLPFLSEQQVEDLTEYLDRYGPMRSMQELRMVASMDYRQLALMPFFTFVGEVRDDSLFPRWNTITRYGKHQLTATGRVPFYNRKGDDSEGFVNGGLPTGYLGYKYRHSLRYEFTYGHFVKAGIMGAQDAGEPFFANKNGWGYDTYSYYIQIRNLGPLENAIIGKYKLSAGMGLVLNTSFSLGKMATLQNLGRHTNTLRVHSSRSEADYFQGAVATIRLLKPLTLTAFASMRAVDATLNDDGTAATITTDGYHRTPKEIEKKYNTRQTAVGTTIGYRLGGLHLGANAVYTHLDRQLKPNTSILYRRHYAQGNKFVNVSMDYGYTHYRFAIGGETAINGHGALATVNTASYQPSAQFSIMALQRFYSFRYTSLHAHSFGDNSRPQNESGAYVGVTWQPISHLHLQGYADYAYFAWARYQTSQSSRAWDFLVQGDYSISHWTLRARHRIRLRQKDNADKTALIPDDEHRSRLSLAYDHPAGWTLKMQGDYVQTAYKKDSKGWMVSEQVQYQHSRWQASMLAGYFKTDDYDSRLYIYERQMQHEFFFPCFYGNGLRLALFARADINSHLRLSAKLGYTNYFDRTTIGTNLQEIPQSHATDLDLQLRWKF